MLGSPGSLGYQGGAVDAIVPSSLGLYLPALERCFFIRAEFIFDRTDEADLTFDRTDEADLTFDRTDEADLTFDRTDEADLTFDRTTTADILLPEEEC